MVLSPLVGFAVAFLVMLAIMWIFRRRNPHKVQARLPADADRAPPSALALGHGLQDAQKTMGVIFLAVVTAGYYPADQTELPLWIVISAASAISFGTYSGGWRIMRTLGRRIIHLDPARGFSAEIGRRGRAVHDGVRLPRPDLDDAHDHLGDHGRGRDQALLRRPVGRGPLDRRRLGPRPSPPPAPPRPWSTWC